MSKLEQIKQTVQYVVSAIASAMEMDVAFIDKNFNLVATSANFLNKRGMKVNAAFIRGVFKKKVVILPNPGFNELCVGCENEGNCPESAELIRTIEYDNEIIGVILMVAYTQKQKDKLLGNTPALLDFIGEMANMVCNQIKLNQLLEKETIIQSQLKAVVNFMDTGILTIDSQGVITQANPHTIEILKLRRRAFGEPLENHLDKENFQSLLKGETIKRREVSFLMNPSVVCLLSGRPIKVDKKVVGAIISLENIEKMRSVVYTYSERSMKTTFEDIHGISGEIDKIKDYAKQIAMTNSTVLIQGESGTGKEMFARAIHSAGSRSEAPFIPINCAAIPEALLESELFGYEEGAFSGAKKGGKPGKFEIAKGGTVFLDEIGDMPLHMQAKLLRVLQEKCVERVGGIRSINVDIRLIAATNQNLIEMQKEGEFREDLYFRLNVMPLSITPLRKRRDDIIALSHHFLKKYTQNVHQKITGFSQEAESCLMAYSWPGNARELQNAIEYAVNMEKGSCVTPESLPGSIGSNKSMKQPLTLAVKMKEYEQTVIKHALDTHGYDLEGKKQAAKELGISVPTLYRKMQSFKHGSGVHISQGSKREAEK